MSGVSFTWNGTNVPFEEGETLAAAILRAGGQQPGLAYFCGIGACQSCIVRCDGRLVEACVTPARAGASVSRPGE